MTPMKRLAYFLLLPLLHLCLCGASARAEKRPIPSLVPWPAEMELKEGFFTLSQETRVTADNAKTAAEGLRLLQQIIHALPHRGAEAEESLIEIDTDREHLHPEGYKMEITPGRISISASDSAGIFYAIQTLKQLVFPAEAQMRQTGGRALSIPCLSVSDYPAYRWRGLMLDVSRHFFSLEYLKKQVDLLASYKMNRMHLHLTDDQGWRIEIKKYPGLTQKGAWRTLNRQDSFCLARAKENPDFMLDPRFIISAGETTLYGGYYTQDEIRDLLAYARLRHVEIIPEIDMPGHMMAAIRLYPQLSCTGTAGWGDTFSFPLCPCNEATFEFLEDVLDEIAALFPSPCIHIGADEVEKNTWAGEACLNLMKEQRLEHPEQLQSYFVERIRTYLSAKGKEVVAWDEALEGGIKPEVNIMYWRDWKGEVAETAVRNGNRIIFAPTHPLYLGGQDSSLYAIYHLNKKFSGIPEGKRALILGAQACVWTEGTPSEDRANYLLYPRLTALAEALWTPAGEQDWNSFKRRMTAQRLRLDRENIKHSLPPYALIPLMSVDTIGKKIQIKLDSEQADPLIYYTTDGSMPTEKSCPYSQEGIPVAGSAEICAAIYDNGLMRQPLTRRSADYHKAIAKAVKYNSPWNKAYPANREETLTDGYRGGERHNDGFWQGFTTDLDVIIDMGEATEISRFSATFMQQAGPGIYMPDYVEVSVSDNGSRFEKALTLTNDVPETEWKLVLRKFAGEMKKTKARYVKVFAKNKADKFIFVDEIVIN